MSKKKKTATITVEIAYPHWMSLRDAKREIREHVNHGRGYMSHGPNYEPLSEGDVRIKNFRGV